MLASLLAVGPATPVSAAPGDSVTIFGPYCENGAGQVLFQVTNAGDSSTELTFTVGPYSRDQTVPADSTASYPINGIPDGTYNAQAFFFISEVASKQVTIDCAYEPPPQPALTAPSVTTSISGNTLSFSWPGVSGATRYDYRVLDDGTRIDYDVDTTGRSHTLNLGTRTGNICVYVSAKADGRQSSTEGSSCKTKNNLPALSRPSVTTAISGDTLSFSWPAVSGATKYDYRILDDGTNIANRLNTTGRSGTLSLAGRTGSICVYVTAKADGRQSSAEGSSCKTKNNLPALTAPTVTTSFRDNLLLFSWPAVSGATKYDYRITDDGTRIDFDINHTGRSHSLNLGNRTGNICVYVTAKADGRQSSTEGRSCKTKSAQVLTRPSVDLDVNGNLLVYSWDAVPGANKYDFRVTDDGRDIRTITNTTGRVWNMSLATLSGSICVYVTAKADGRRSSPEGSACHRIINTAPLRKPTVTASISGSALSFSWPVVSGATKYDYRVLDDGTRIDYRLNITGRSHTLNLGTKSGNICVYVAAKADGRLASPEGASCKTRTVQTPLDEPRPSSPFRAVINSDIEVDWADVSNAADYSVRIERNDSHYAFRSSDTSDLSVSFRTTGVYCFYVTARPTANSSAHIASGESEPPACVTVSSIEPPSVTSWMRDSVLHFEVGGAPGASEYRWRVGNSSERGTRPNAGRSSVDLSELDGTLRCVYVKAVWPDGRESREASSCNLVGTTPTPQVRYDINGEVEFTWDDVPGAIWYDLVVEHPDDDNVTRRVNKGPTASVPIDDTFGDRVCGYIIPGRRDLGDPSNKVCIDAVVTAESLGIASTQTDELEALNRIAHAIGLTGGMPNNPWLSGDPNNLSTMRLRTLSDARQQRLENLVATVGYEHFESFLTKTDAKLRRDDINYANYLYRMLPLSYVVGSTNGEYERAVGGLSVDQNSVITMTVNIAGIGADAYAGQKVFVGTVKGSAVFAGLSLAAGGTFLVLEIQNGEFGNSAQDIVEVAGLGVSAVTLVAALAGLGPVGLGILAVVGVVLGFLAIFLPDSGRTDIKLSDPMSVVTRKVYAIRQGQLEDQVASLHKIIAESESRITRRGGPTNHMFLLEDRNTATEAYVVHRFWDKHSQQWYGVIAVTDWSTDSDWDPVGPTLPFPNRVLWESSYEWENVIPISQPSDGTVIAFRDVREVLTGAEQALADHIAAGP